MRKILAALLITVAVQSAASAQDGQRMRRTPEDRAKNQMEMMQPLKLTEEQQKQVYDVNMQLANDAKGGAEESREAKMERAKAFQAKRKEAYQKILTKEQFTQFEAIQAERRQQMKDRRAESKESGVE